MSSKLGLSDLQLENQRVLLRVDFNVPLDKNANISDDSRIQAALPTIQYILKQNASLVLMSHMGRPKGEVRPELSLSPCAKRLSELIQQEVKMAPDCVGEEVEALCHSLQPGELCLLENLRFHLAETKPDTDPSFAEGLAQLGDVYVNDAFGTAHRSHSSTATITRFFPDRAAAGLLLKKEVEVLDHLLHHAEKPFYAILGGAKVSSKLGVIRSLLDRVDGLVIGGAMAFTFLQAQGKEVGDSLVEPELEEEARQVIRLCEERGKELILPVDIVAANAFSEDADTLLSPMSEGIPEGYQGLDIGPKTLEEIKAKLGTAATVIWNGPLGVFELPPFAKGTLETAKFLSESNAQTVVGGGDSVAAVKQSGLSDTFSHLSTGGGATLEYLEYGSLPGIEALSDRTEPANLS